MQNEIIKFTLFSLVKRNLSFQLVFPEVPFLKTSDKSYTKTFLATCD